MDATTRRIIVGSRGNKLSQGLEDLFPSDQAREIHYEYVLAVYPSS
jgi:hypothetical protein